MENANQEKRTFVPNIAQVEEFFLASLPSKDKGTVSGSKGQLFADAEGRIRLETYVANGSVIVKGQPKARFHKYKDASGNEVKEDRRVAYLSLFEAETIAGAMRAFLEKGFDGSKEYIKAATDGVSDDALRFTHGKLEEGHTQQVIVCDLGTDNRQNQYFSLRIMTPSEVANKENGRYKAGTKSVSEVAGVLQVFEAVIAKAKQAKGIATPAFETTKYELNGSGFQCQLNIGREYDLQYFAKVYLKLVDPADQNNKMSSVLSLKELGALDTILKLASEGGADAAKQFIARHNKTSWPAVNSDTALVFDHKSSKSPKKVEFAVEGEAVRISINGEGPNAKSGSLLLDTPEAITAAAAATRSICQQAALVNITPCKLLATSPSGETTAKYIVGGKVGTVMNRMRREGFDAFKIIEGDFPWGNAGEKKAPAAEAPAMPAPASVQPEVAPAAPLNTGNTVDELEPEDECVVAGYGL